MSKKIIILGAKGFIGSWLVKRFSSNLSYRVRGYSSRDCDLLSPISIKNALTADIQSKDCIIIMASSIIRLKENSYEAMIKNILMAENISQFIEEHPVSQFIFLSTVDVYGLIETGTMISETLPLNPCDYYAISKLSSEFILKRQCAKKKIPLLILRLSGVYGPGDKGKSTINRLVESAIKEKKIIIEGDGRESRDFVYVDDVYKIINSAIDAKLNMVLNLATGKSYSITQIVEVIKACYAKEFLVEYNAKQKDDEKRTRDMIYDITLLTKTFPVINFVSLREGISLYLGQYIKTEKTIALNHGQK